MRKDEFDDASEALTSDDFADAQNSCEDKDQVSTRAGSPEPVGGLTEEEIGRLRRSVEEVVREMADHESVVLRRDFSRQRESCVLKVPSDE